MYLILISAAGLITEVLLLSGEKTRRWLLYIGLVTIAVGHRGIYIGKHSYFVPLEVIILLLFALLFLNEIIHKTRHQIKIPALLIFVSLWGLLRAIISLISGTPWDPIFDWTSQLLLGVPTFWVVRRFLAREEGLSISLKIITIVSVLMSILAVLEYRFSTANYIITPDGFVRATFGFWGYPIGAAIVTWGMLIAYYEMINPSKPKSFWINLAIFALCGMAVYISGQRSSWIGVAVALLVLTLSRRSKGWIGLIGLVVIVRFLPAVFWSRFDTVTNYVQYGVISDTSTSQRLIRWSWGWQAMIQNPVFGVGYEHFLTHNAFLEIGSTLGIVPAVAFLVLIIQLIWRIASVALKGSTPIARRYGWLFLAIAVTWVMQLNVETVIQTLPVGVAFWPYMALAWYLPDIFRAIPEPIANHSARMPFK